MKRPQSGSESARRDAVADPASFVESHWRFGGWRAAGGDETYGRE
jgi:hypothetical protein